MAFQQHLPGPFLDRPRRRAGGFTITEVMIVVGVVILLLSILIVAMNKAVQAAQTANTRSLLVSLKQGLVRFKTDVGYYPPVLGLQRELDLSQIPPLGPLDTYRNQLPHWASVTTLADYLIGYGNERQDGHGDPGNPDVAALGIRSPGRDGVWGATIFGAADGSLGLRNLEGAAAAGQVFGPYIELKDERLLGSINGDTDTNGDLVVYFPGEGNYDDIDPKVIVDYWGTPIQYFRSLYPAGALNQSYRRSVQDRDGDGTPDGFPLLGDVFVLRPFDVDAGKAINGLCDINTIVGCPDGGEGDPTSTVELNAAEFGLLSAGPDRRVQLKLRRDPDELNRDNVVEVGP